MFEGEDKAPEQGVELAQIVALDLDGLMQRLRDRRAGNGLGFLDARPGVR